MIKILIADDHKVFRDGIQSIIDSIPDIEVVGHASDGQEVIDQIDSCQPDLILMDISMGNMNGIITTKILKEKYPNILVLVLSMHQESEYIIKMLEAGASGYLLKDAGSSEVINAIRAIYNGATFYSKQISTAIVEYLTQSNKKKVKKEGIPLTPREIEVLQLIADEYSNPEIAKKLFISIRTVDTHRRNLLEKLQVKNTAGLVKYAFKMGIIT